jgi:hypothetical protein
MKVFMILGIRVSSFPRIKISVFRDAKVLRFQGFSAPMFQRIKGVRNQYFRVSRFHIF